MTADNSSKLLELSELLARLCDGVVERMHLEAVHLPVLAPDRVTKWVLIGVFYFG